ncbi:NBS-LRR type disease resistance protein [Theobroma cacao]|uniref:NBS-LRR type disease resistance protein n=1 Tax=Theobroma cacao TaxID=3641 RepID=S1RWE3_THECC|nr:NBS-LRR type disease resistance protein [Theobroma cacao]
MVPLNQVQLWLSRVQIVRAEAKVLIKGGTQQIQKLCFGGCFSKNCKSSYNFGKQVTRKFAEIVDLKNEGDFERVAENELAPHVDVRPTEPTVGLESTLANVWHLLEEKGVGIIGLYGLGGVGKTTLLTQTNNKLSNNLIGYDIVIWVVASKDHTIEKVQKKIGEKDDVWERVDLIKVGIPVPNQDNDSKLVFTTRFLEVCGEMEAHEKIEVKCLSENAVWKLFEEKVGGETLDSHLDIRELAKQVAAKCGGLPLALITIGQAMACKKMPQNWKYAIEVLKEFPHKLPRMDEQVYPLLKFSYDSLLINAMRSCLLYCSLFFKYSKISIYGLIGFWFCKGFLNEFDNISRARMQGYNIINSLLNACLLERDEDVKFVRMHDVIHDMLLWIARECEALEKKFLVQAGERSIEAFDVGNWEGVRMSLVKNGIEDLRGNLTYPNLQTLFLIDNKLKVISDGFF